jgi:hypothetical protein
MTTHALDAPPAHIAHESSLSRGALSALMLHEILAIRIPGFLSKPELQGVRQGIQDVGLEYYTGDTKASTQERKGKIGPNLYRFKDDIHAYFERTRVFEQQDRPQLFAKVDVLGRFVEALRQAYAPRGTVERARSVAGPLSSCTVRDLPNAPPHRDWIKAELPAFDAFSRLTDQFAWNVYVSVGERGGETLIYDTCEVEDALTRPPSLELPPKPGDLLLFRTRHVHAVRATTGGDRWTVSGFWGPTSDGRMLYWV